MLEFVESGHPIFRATIPQVGSKAKDMTNCRHCCFDVGTIETIICVTQHNLHGIEEHETLHTKHSNPSWEDSRVLHSCQTWSKRYKHTHKPTLTTPRVGHVEIGQHFMTKDTAEFSQFRAAAFRECTLSRDEEASQPKGWIQSNTKFGPVLEVATCRLHDKYGVEIRIMSMNRDNFHSWVRISHGSNHEQEVQLEEHALKLDPNADERTKQNHNDDDSSSSTCMNTMKRWWSGWILENSRSFSETIPAFSSLVWQQVEGKHQEKISILCFFIRSNLVPPSFSRTFRTQTYLFHIDNFIYPNIFVQNILHVGCAINLHSISIRDWHREDKIWTTHLWIPWTKIVRILTRSTWKHSIMHNTCIKHGRNIKTQCMGRHQSCIEERIKVLSDVRNTCSLLFSESFFDGNWRGHTRKYTCHVGFLQQSLWNMIGEYVQRPERQVVQQSRSLQSNQPIPNPSRDKNGQPVVGTNTRTAQDERKFSGSIHVFVMKKLSKTIQRDNIPNTFIWWQQMFQLCWNTHTMCQTAPSVGGPYTTFQQLRSRLRLCQENIRFCRIRQEDREPPRSTCFSSRSTTKKKTCNPFCAKKKQMIQDVDTVKLFELFKTEHQWENLQTSTKRCLHQTVYNEKLEDNNSGPCLIGSTNNGTIIKFSFHLVAS